MSACRIVQGCEVALSTAAAADIHPLLRIAVGIQAEKLDELLQKRGIGIDKVLNFDVPDSTLVRALSLCCLRILVGLCI